jgi:hypothetical protein
MRVTRLGAPFPIRKREGAGQIQRHEHQQIRQKHGRPPEQRFLKALKDAHQN